MKFKEQDKRKKKKKEKTYLFPAPLSVRTVPISRSSCKENSDPAEPKPLPRSKDTLVRKLKDQLPLCKLHEKTVWLDSTKVPTRASHNELMMIFDLEDNLQRTMQSSIRDSVYTGMAMLTDVVREP
ncbi:hypothetical protein V8F20_011843 [Naviculisporaceae sp. PSN 640]